MKEYKLTPEGLKKLQKNVLLRTVPFLLFAGGIGVFIGTLGTKGKETDLAALLIALFIVAVYVSFSIYRGLKRKRKLLESYTFSISFNAVMREQGNTPAIGLYINEIQEIVKAKSGAFTLRGKERRDVIYISAQIDRYADLETSLESIRPITTKSSQSRLQVYRVLFPLLSVGLLICVYTVMNKLVVAVSGTLLLAMMVWGCIELQRNRNVDHRTKRRLWRMAAVLLSVVYTMYAKLYGSITGSLSGKVWCITASRHLANSPHPLFRHSFPAGECSKALDHPQAKAAAKKVLNLHRMHPDGVVADAGHPLGPVKCHVHWISRNNLYCRLQKQRQGRGSILRLHGVLLWS